MTHLLYQAIEKAADAPNHGMREPWRVVHVPKDRLGDMSKDISKFAFPNELDKQQCHYDAVTKLGGMLLLILKTDPRQRQNDENYLCIWCICTKSYVVTLVKAGIGTCWKSPLYIYDPKVRKTLGIKKDEVLAGFLYLTDLEEDMPKAPRKNRNLITLY